MRSSSRIVVAALATGLVAMASGCGGGGKKTPLTTSTQTMTTSTQTTTGGSASTFASAKNCRQFSGFAAKVAHAIAVTSGNPATALNEESKELQALANGAPASIRGDFETFATAFTGYLHALEKAGYKPGTTSTSPPTAAQIAALTSAAKVFRTAKLTEAEASLSAWAAANCK